MRRYTFYLAVALVAFGIGLFVVFEFFFNSPQLLLFEKVEVVENNYKLSNEDEKIKYGCKEKELIPFWEKLDKEAFLKFSKYTSEEFWGKNSIEIRFDWKEIKDFDCSYFREFQAIDVNDDGENEVLVRGRVSSNRGDMEIFLFQLKQNKYEPILFDISGKELLLTKTKYNGYSEIITRTEYFTGGGRNISHYRFDGKSYKPIKCFIEYSEIQDIKGNWIKYKNL